MRPLTIPPLAEATGAELRWRYAATDDPADRLRYQIVWLAQGGKHAPEIAALVPHRHAGLGGGTAAGRRP